MTSKKPIIGILSDIDKEGKEDRPLYFVKSNYVTAVNKAGGIPFIIPPGEDEKDIMKLTSNIDGLLIPGGDDIDPKYFNEDPHPSIVLVDPEITRFQMEFCQIAVNQNIPVLGICAGMQLINILFGGDIYQDIPSQLPGSIKHKKDKNEEEAVFHSIKIEKNTGHFNILQRENVLVNSTHHQAVRNVAEGFIVAARSEDGIIEAIESRKHPFVLGVQYHPEDLFQQEEVFLNLFKKLAREACRSL
jgi:putative glutamine amidotransferase